MGENNEKVAPAMTPEHGLLSPVSWAWSPSPGHGALSPMSWSPSPARKKFIVYQWIKSPGHQYPGHQLFAPYPGHAGLNPGHLSPARYDRHSKQYRCCYDAGDHLNCYWENSPCPIGF